MSDKKDDHPFYGNSPFADIPGHEHYFINEAYKRAQSITTVASDRPGKPLSEHIARKGAGIAGIATTLTLGSLAIAEKISMSDNQIIGLTIGGTLASILVIPVLASGVVKLCKKIGSAVVNKINHSNLDR